MHELELEHNGCSSKDDLRRGFISGTGRMLLAAIASMRMSYRVEGTKGTTKC